MHLQKCLTFGVHITLSQRPVFLFSEVYMKKGKKLCQVLIPLFGAVTVIILFRCVLFIGYVPTSSMEPTLKTGSVLLEIRIIGSIETGDIIVFRHNERLFVKRVAAVGGDMIEHDGQLVTVPVDCFYVLGDNTEHSYDSRYWVCPFVTLKDIVAKVCAE